ncbi:hypothetical protein, partial [Escherichia coli]|uniref:hypothetical protein n=1 Tax=Escherichia coli TaxID=562 RepID=UPI0032DA4C7B
DRNRSHWSTSKTPSYTKSVSWQHHQIIKPMLPFYAVMVLVLAMVTYIPQISMALPRALGY